MFLLALVFKSEVMKKILLFHLFVAMLLSKSALGQDLQISNGNPEVMSSLLQQFKIFADDEDGYYLIKRESSRYFIQKLDKSMNPVIQQPLKLHKGLITYKLEAAYNFYGTLYIFVTHQKVNETILYYQKLDKQTLLPLTELTEITTVENVKGNWADFHFAISKKETKLMIACRIRLALSKTQINELYVFDKDMELVWRRKDSFSFRGTGPRDNRYLVDETGNITVLSLLKQESLLNRNKEVKNSYAIYRYTHEGNFFKEYPFTLPEKYIRGIKVVAGDHGELYCAGMYSNLLIRGVAGTFFFKIDEETGALTNNNTFPFESALLAELEEMKDPVIDEAELMSYVVSDMVLRSNNHIVTIAEQVFTQTYNTYNNIIVSDYDAFGNLNWTRVIRKKQNFNYNNLAPTGIPLNDYRSYIIDSGYVNPYINNYCSYALMASPDRNAIVLVYNDDIRNKDQEISLNPLSVPRDSYLLAVIIDEFGNITRKPLLAWGKKSTFPEPIRFYDSLNDALIIPGIRNRQISYYKVTATF